MATTKNWTPQCQPYISKTSSIVSDSHSRLTATSKHDQIFNDNDMDKGTRLPKRRKFNLGFSSKPKDAPTLQRQIVPYYPHNLYPYVVLPTEKAIESALRVDMKKLSINKIRQSSEIKLDLSRMAVVQCRCSLTVWCYSTGAPNKRLVCHLTKSLPLQISSDQPNYQSVEFASSDAFFDVSSGVLGIYRWAPEGRVYTLADQYSIQISIEPQDNLECWPLVDISPLASYGPITRAIKNDCASRMDVMLNCKTVIKTENEKLSAPISMSCGSLSCGNNAKGCHGEEQNTRHTLEIHTRWSHCIVSSKAKGKPLKHYMERWARKEAALGIITAGKPETISISTASSSSCPDSGHGTLITSEDSRQFNSELEAKNPLPVSCAGENAPLRVSLVEVRRPDPSINTQSSHREPVAANGTSLVELTPAVPLRLRNHLHVPSSPLRDRCKRKVPLTSKPLFHTITKQRLYPGDDLPDTDEETEEHWLNHKHQDIVGDYTDLNEFEKEYIKRWNVFITREQHTVPNFLANAMKRFVDANGTWINEKRSRQREWTRHCMYLIMRGVMTEQEFSTYLDILDYSRVNISSTQKSVVQLVRDRGRLECGANCLQGNLPRGRVVHPTEGITCHGEKCLTKFYHRPCAMLSGRHLENWLCDLCFYDRRLSKQNTLLKD